MKLRYIQFTRKPEASKLATIYRPYVMVVSVGEIKKIESRMGSEHVYLTVNDIDVEGSYEKLLEILANIDTEFESSLLSFK